MTVKEARENKGMTQVDLAVAADVGLGTIQRIEGGMIEVAQVGTLRKICNALGITLVSLFAQND